MELEVQQVTAKPMVTRQNSRRQEQVRGADSAAAERPRNNDPFPVGRELALGLGYPKKILDSPPAVSVEALSDVSNVSIFAEIPPGSTVLDLGCGAGCGLDDRCQEDWTGQQGSSHEPQPGDAGSRPAGAAESGASSVSFFELRGESLPLSNASVDVALFNGVFSLSLDGKLLFSELFRVASSSGTVYEAEVILREPISDADMESGN